MPQTHTQASRHIAYAQRERLAFIEVRSYFYGDLTRAHIEERFGVKPAASARDLIAYRDIAPDNLRYNAAQRCYQPTASFQPVFAHTSAHVLNWFRTGSGDGLEIASPHCLAGGQGSQHLLGFPADGEIALGDFGATLVNRIGSPGKRHSLHHGVDGDGPADH